MDAESGLVHANYIRAVVRSHSKRALNRRHRQRRRATYRVVLDMAVARVVGFAELYLLMRAVRQLRPDLLRPSAPPAVDDLVRRLRRAAKSFEVLKAVWANELGTNLEDVATWTSPNTWQDFVLV